MDYRRIFENAFGNIEERYPCSDHETAFSRITERAEKMKKDEKIRQGRLTEITPEHYEPKKSHKVLSAVVGVAGAAAVLTGAVFGVSWLNEHGGLKGPDVQGAGSKAPDTYYGVSVGTSEKRDISALAGKTFEFSDMTVHVSGAAFDGKFIRLDYYVSYEDGANPSGFTLDPLSYIYGYSAENIIMDVLADDEADVITDNKDNKFMAFKQFVPVSLDEFRDYELAPAYYPLKQNTERINDFTVTIRKDENNYVRQPIHDARLQEIDDDVWCNQLDITPLALGLGTRSDNEEATLEKIKSGENVDPIVWAVRQDGNKIELARKCVSSSATGGGEYGDFQWEGNYIYYMPDINGGDLTEMKAFEINGKLIELTESAKPIVTTVLENGDVVVSAETTMTTTAPAETTTVAEESDADTTAVADDHSRTGYYEGEAALDILKLYAGDEYCYPLEDNDISKLSYRTIDSWTGGDRHNSYRFNIAVTEGEPIFAVTGGTVIEVNVDWLPHNDHSKVDEGMYVVIQAADGRKWSYNHLSDHYVNVGDTVSAGDRIAAGGATGWCTGPCLGISFPDSAVIDPEMLDPDLSQIAGIYAPGEEPYEVVESDETSENTARVTLPEFPIAIGNGNGFYGEYLDTPITGDEAWELVKERGGIDFEFPLPYDKTLFVFDGCEFYINYADCDVTALAGGTVEFAGFYYGWGNSVLILDDNGHYWLWGHLAKELNVAEGDTVEAGAKIGHTGSSGYALCQCYAMRVG